jgi:prephenate dehydrogenase
MYNPPVMWQERVCIVGLGLMGGSLALALRPYLKHLTVVDTDADTLAAAQELADTATADLAQGVRGADLIVLATPVRTILRLLADLPSLRPQGGMVLDVGSTKTEIGRAMAALPPRFQAIGGHPMCGKEKAGFAAATPDLYQDRTFILCRNGRTDPAIEALARRLIDQVGARPLLLPADTHDALVAATSHLPYLVAAALMRAVSAVDDGRLWSVSASGFHDTARLSASDPQMMLDILLTNRAAVLSQLERYQQELAAVVELLQSGDEETLARWLAQVQRQHADYRRDKG